MRKLYLSPTCGTSASLPANISHLFSSEPATYRQTIAKSQLEAANITLPPGSEQVTKTVSTIFGDEEIVSWDEEKVRYYIEFDNLEEVIEDIGNATGLRLTFEPWDRENQFQSEFMEVIFGLPEIENGNLVAEIETDLPNFDFAAKKDDGEGWKTSDD